jgi:N-acetylglutamate synthase-like GNAT family acetyltransferase
MSGVRKFTELDLPNVQALIARNLNRLLPRSNEEIISNKELWWVAEHEGKIVGCACLEIYSPKMAELRSLVVDDAVRGLGYGKSLVEAVKSEVNLRRIPELLVITSTPEFFEKLNFGACLGEKYALFLNGVSKR